MLSAPVSRAVPEVPPDALVDTDDAPTIPLEQAMCPNAMGAMPSLTLEQLVGEELPAEGKPPSDAILDLLTGL